MGEDFNSLTIDKKIETMSLQIQVLLDAMKDARARIATLEAHSAKIEERLVRAECMLKN